MSIYSGGTTCQLNSLRKGYNFTIGLLLDAPENLNQPPVHQDLSTQGPLPNLKTLKIAGQSLGSTRAALKSLALA